MTGRPAGAIDHDTQIQLARNREALLDQQARHRAPLGTRLMRDQLHPVDLIGELVGLTRIRGQLDASALASAARVNLRFDDNRAAAEPLGHRFRVRGVEDGVAFGNRHAVLGKNLFGLILVNFHMWKTVNRIVGGLSASSSCE